MDPRLAIIGDVVAENLTALPRQIDKALVGVSRIWIDREILVPSLRDRSASSSASPRPNDIPERRPETHAHSDPSEKSPVQAADERFGLTEY